MTLRRIVIVAAVVVVIAAAALFLLRRTLVQGQLREAIEARLSATLGTPVSIGRLRLTLFPRVALRGGDVRVGDAQVQAPSLAIERVRVLPRLASLFSDRVVIDRIDLEGFSFSVLRNERGAWELPAVAPVATQGTDASLAIERVRMTGASVRVFERGAGGQISEQSSIDDLEADVTADAGGMHVSSIQGKIGGSSVSGSATMDAREARLQFDAPAIADESLPAFLRLLGSDRPASLRLAAPASVSAVVRVDRGSLRLTGRGTLRAPLLDLSPLRLERFEAPFAIDRSKVTFEPATFVLYRGKHTGTIVFDGTATPALWTLNGSVTGIDAGEFLRALNGGDQRVDGTANVTAALRGHIGQPLAETVAGRMRVEVSDGVVRDFALLAAIGRALKLAQQQGADTRFSRLAATLSIDSGMATTDDLVLESSDVRVQAAGRINADRSLLLRGIAAVSPERSAAAIASIHELKGLRNSRGEVEVPLTISGTLDAPSFEIDLESMIRKGIADELRRAIRRIIR
jgi:AsmA protein